MRISWLSLLGVIFGLIVRSGCRQVIVDAVFNEPEYEVPTDFAGLIECETAADGMEEGLDSLRCMNARTDALIRLLRWAGKEGLSMSAGVRIRVHPRHGCRLVHLVPLAKSTPPDASLDVDSPQCRDDDPSAGDKPFRNQDEHSSEKHDVASDTLSWNAPQELLDVPAHLRFEVWADASPSDIIPGWKMAEVDDVLLGRERGEGGAGSSETETDVADELRIQAFVSFSFWSPAAKLALRLLFEFSLGDASFWAPYLDTLPAVGSPEADSLPCMWTEESHPELFHEIKHYSPPSIRDEFARQYNEASFFVESVRGLCRVFPDRFLSDSVLCSRVHQRWAYAMVASRSWSTQRRRISDSDVYDSDKNAENVQKKQNNMVTCVFMLPIADLLNHAVVSTVQSVFRENDGGDENNDDNGSGKNSRDRDDNQLGDESNTFISTPQLERELRDEFASSRSSSSPMSSSSLSPAVDLSISYSDRSFTSMFMSYGFVPVSFSRQAPWQHPSVSSSSSSSSSSLSANDTLAQLVGTNAHLDLPSPFAKLRRLRPTLSDGTEDSQSNVHESMYLYEECDDATICIEDGMSGSTSTSMLSRCEAAYGNRESNVVVSNQNQRPSVKKSVPDDKYPSENECRAFLSFVKGSGCLSTASASSSSSSSSSLFDSVVEAGRHVALNRGRILRSGVVTDLVLMCYRVMAITFQEWTERIPDVVRQRQDIRVCGHRFRVATEEEEEEEEELDDVVSGWKRLELALNRLLTSSSQDSVKNQDKHAPKKAQGNDREGDLDGGDVGVGVGYVETCHALSSGLVLISPANELSARRLFALHVRLLLDVWFPSPKKVHVEYLRTLEATTVSSSNVKSTVMDFVESAMESTEIRDFLMFAKMPVYHAQGVLSPVTLASLSSLAHLRLLFRSTLHRVFDSFKNCSVQS